MHIVVRGNSPLIEILGLDILDLALRAVGNLTNDIKWFMNVTRQMTSGMHIPQTCKET